MEKSRIVKLAHCGSFQCNNMVEIDENKPAPVSYICGKCTEKFEKGIVEWLHAKTGKLKGGYHIIDGYTD